MVENVREGSALDVYKVIFVGELQKFQGFYKQGFFLGGPPLFSPQYRFLCVHLLRNFA